MKKVLHVPPVYYFLSMQLLTIIAIHGTRPLISLIAQSNGASTLLVGMLVSAFAFFRIYCNPCWKMDRQKTDPTACPAFPEVESYLHY